MTQKALQEMIKAARADLAGINEYSTKAALKDAAKKMLGRPTTNRDMLFWPAGLLLMGLYDISRTLPESSSIRMEIHKDITNYFETWSAQTGEKISYPDDSLAGLTIINLYKETGETGYLRWADKIYEFLLSYDKNAEESIVYNQKAGNNYIFADGSGETAMFLLRYGKLTGKQEATLLGLKQLTNFHKHGMDSLSGLPYHAFSLEKNEKLGLLAWGRACAWLLMGYTEALHSEYRNEILDNYLALCRDIMRYKRPDGGFSWHIPAVDGAADTSASAMIGYCLAEGLSLGVFGNDTDKYNKAVLDVQNFILKNTKNGYVMSSLSGCEDLAVHRQIYGHYPFGQGSALSLIAACPAAV